MTHTGKMKPISKTWGLLPGPFIGHFIGVTIVRHFDAEIPAEILIQYLAGVCGGIIVGILLVALTNFFRRKKFKETE